MIFDNGMYLKSVFMWSDFSTLYTTVSVQKVFGKFGLITPN